MPSLLRSGVELAAGVIALFALMSLVIVVNGQYALGLGAFVAFTLIIAGLLWVGEEMSPKSLDWTEVAFTMGAGMLGSLWVLLVPFSGYNLGTIGLAFVVLGIPALILYGWTFRRDSFMLGSGSMS